MFVPSKIKTLLAQVFGIKNPCPYEEKYKDTKETLLRLDKEFKERLSCCKNLTNESFRSFDRSIYELDKEIRLLITNCEADKDADSSRTPR